MNHSEDPQQENDNRETGRLLETSRPVPRAAFRGELRRRLVEGAEASPSRIRLLIFTYAASGAALLIIAVIGIAGSGPLAAG